MDRCRQPLPGRWSAIAVGIGLGIKVRGKQIACVIGPLPQVAKSVLVGIDERGGVQGEKQGQQKAHCKMPAP